MLIDYELKQKITREDGKIRKKFRELWEKYESAVKMTNLPDPNRAEHWRIIAVHRKRQIIGMFQMEFS